MIHPHRVVTPVAEHGAATLPDLVRRLHPAGGLRVEAAQLLQLAVLLLAEQLYPHRTRHLNGAPFRLVLLTGLQRSLIKTEAPASRRTFRRAVNEYELACSLVVRHYVRLTAAFLHGLQCLELLRLRLESRDNLFPGYSLMPAGVLVESALQCSQQFVSLLSLHPVPVLLVA